MTPVWRHADLPRTLLVAIGSAHTTGASPPDWSDCAAVIGVMASPRSINRALSHLAEAGLIEGVMTEDGWTSLRPTPRGLAQIGRHVRPAHPNGDRTAAPALVCKRSASERLSATVDEVSREMRTISRYTGATWLRTRAAMTPRANASREGCAGEPRSCAHRIRTPSCRCVSLAAIVARVPSRRRAAPPSREHLTPRFSPRCRMSLDALALR